MARIAFALAGIALLLGAQPALAEPAPADDEVLGPDAECELVSISIVGRFPYVAVAVHEECLRA